MSTLKVATIQDTSGNNSSTPNEVAQGRAKAWVNFNGTGTVAIRNDFNVTSITDTGTGRYTINFTNAMPNANYAAAALSGFGIAQNSSDTSDTPFTTTTARIVSYSTSAGTDTDISQINVVFFGD